jgi:hypothetical protein
MRKSLSDAGVAALKPRAQRYAHPDPELSGHYVRVTPSGAKSFVVVTRDPAGKQVWATIGPVDLMTIDEAREKGRDDIKRVQAGKPAFETPVEAESFEDVAEAWLKRHVAVKGLRSQGEITRLLKAHVYPERRRRSFLDIRRSDVAKMLDEVKDDHRARQADYVLAIVRGIMHWRASRADDCIRPIVQGMLLPSHELDQALAIAGKSDHNRVRSSSERPSGSLKYNRRPPLVGLATVRNLELDYPRNYRVEFRVADMRSVSGGSRMLQNH